MSSSVSQGVPTLSQVKTHNIWNIVKFLAFIMPHSIVIFFVLLSVFNTNFKALFYLAGIFIIQIILRVTHSTNTQSAIAHKVCTIFNSDLEFFDIPAYSVSTLAYTFSYLLFPMVMFGVVNELVLSILGVLTAFVCLVQYRYGCLTPVGIITGIMVGTLVGFLWALSTSTISSDQLYFSEYISDKVACSVPTKQAFKCNVYKNGKLISQL